MQTRSEATRAHILQAAEAVFAQNGYEASGVAEICQAAGVSKGAFYHHFPSKRDVFLALLNAWLEELEQRLAEFQSAEVQAPEALLAMASSLDTVFSAAGGRLPMFLEFWAQASRDPEFWQATVAPYHRYLEFFTRLIEKGIQEGSLRQVDPQAAARVIISLAVGTTLQGLLDPQGADWPAVARQGLDTIVTGISMEKK